MTQGTMKAAVYKGPRHLQIEEIAIPDVGPDDVLIKVSNCGICGSDVHSYRAGFYIQPGAILGHEFVGRAVKVGRNVNSVREGDRITGFTVKPCGKCYWCEHHQYGLCPDIFSSATGYGKPGAFAEYILLESPVINSTLFHIPDAIDDVSAATIEPLSCGVYTVKYSEVKAGDKVVILGAGIIGNACLQAAKAVGAKVYVIEVSPLRLKLALESGADGVFNPTTGAALEWVKQVVGVGRYHFGEGGMADVVIDAAGVPQTVVQSFEMVRSGGTICFVALAEKSAPLDITKIVHKQPRIIGALGGDLPGAIAGLASGAFRTRQLVTHLFPLEAASEAFETQLSAADTLKVMLQMTTS